MVQRWRESLNQKEFSRKSKIGRNLNKENIKRFKTIVVERIIWLLGSGRKGAGKVGGESGEDISGLANIAIFVERAINVVEEAIEVEVRWKRFGNIHHGKYNLFMG